MKIYFIDMYLHLFLTWIYLLLLLAALLVPEFEPRLLSQSTVHRAAIKTLTSIIPGSFHVTTSQLEARKIDAEFLGHIHCVLGILDS